MGYFQEFIYLDVLLLAEHIRLESLVSTGASKRVDGKMQPAFAFHVNGTDAQGAEHFGEEWGTMLAEEIPDFFVELGQMISAEHLTYESWYTQNPEKLKKIAEKYIR